MRNTLSFVFGVPLYFILAAAIGIGFNFNAPLSLPLSGSDASVCENAVVPLPCRDGMLTMQSTPEEYIAFFGLSDAGSYVRGAVDLVTEDYETLRDWAKLGYVAWPPGMFFVNASALVIDAPIGVVQWVFAAALWSIAFSLAGITLVRRFGSLLWMLAPAPILFLPLFATNYLHFGIVMTETSSSALFVIGLLLLAFPVPFGRTKYWLWLLAGLIFAAAVMMRAQVFYITLFALMGFAALFALALLAGRHEGGWRRPGIGFFIGFLIGMLPWIHANGKLYSVDYAYSLPFIVEAYPNAGERNWLALGGIRSACVVNEQRCREVRSSFEAGNLDFDEMRSEILASFFAHPVEFIAHKFPIFANYFMSDNTYPAATVYKALSIENVVFLTVFALSLISLLRQPSLNSIGVALLLLLLLFAIVGPPFAVHYEVRYLYLAKVLMLVSPLLVLGRRELFCLNR